MTPHSQRRIRRILPVVMAAALLPACDNPFFPPLGDPIQSQLLRTTPKGVIRQLVNSYESQNAGLFRALLAENEFRFYIPSVLANELKRIDKSRTEQVEDTAWPLVPGGLYAYLTYQDELRVHRNLFGSAANIKFVNGLEVDRIVYEDTLVRVDTIVVLDTVPVDSARADSAWQTAGASAADTVVVDTVLREVRDTLGCELSTVDAKLSIQAQQVREISGTDIYEFDVWPQVFVMRRGSDGLWSIVKWFEVPYVNGAY